MTRLCLAIDIPDWAMAEGWLATQLFGLIGGVATADSGTINTGLFAVTDPGRRGAFLAIHAISGFGAACVAPVLFGVLLDFAGGCHRTAAWIIAFASQAAINMVWPLSYLLKRK